VVQDGPQVEVRLVAAGKPAARARRCPARARGSRWRSPDPETGGTRSDGPGMRTLRPATAHTARRRSGHPAAPARGQRAARPGSLPVRRDQLLFPRPPRMRAQ
jgi:hypothetical protein